MIGKGRFGNALRILDGWPISKNAYNASGLDCDLIVSTIWGEWQTKPHYWGAGRFYGDRGTVGFWVKTTALNPGMVFLQGNIAWGRKERDLFRIDVDSTGVLSASIRDIAYTYHKIESSHPVWVNNEWQHIAVAYDRAYGLKMYHNGILVASNWGDDAWWQTPLPGLFSPFLPESFYDEICFFDHPLKDAEVKALYRSNDMPDKILSISELDNSALDRVRNTYADLELIELPELFAAGQRLVMRQTQIADCHDEKIPAWWVMDGRYELAWPHPYLLFTFILGDVDFHGTRVDIDIKKGESPNYMAAEGILDGMKVFAKNSGFSNSGSKLFDLEGYNGFYSSHKIDMKNYSSLHIPLVREYGTPPGLIDTGSLNLPLSGKTRIHEIQLWNVSHEDLKSHSSVNSDIVWYLNKDDNIKPLGRYEQALTKLKGRNERTVMLGSPFIPVNDSGNITVNPLQTINIISPDMSPDMAVDRIGLNFSLMPKRDSDVMWLKLRDPANPSRIWAQTCIRINFENNNHPQKIEIELDIIDIMLAGEDRLWIDLKFANSQNIVTTSNDAPRMYIFNSRDRSRSMAEYAKHEIIPARMQYIKEYNYQPWLFEGDPASIRNWSNFGGPYDMVYPPQAILRHQPDNRLAKIYRRLTTDRARPYGGNPYLSIIESDERYQLPSGIPIDAPSWAIWERELYKKLLKTVHWIAGTQRKDGSFWGGFNDDVFIPLGYPGIPLMGDTIASKSFLRLYDGLEEAGIFKNGYCDVFPIDPLHITDFLTSRGLMLAFAPGDPYVFEREMITAGVYDSIMKNTNSDRAQKGLGPFINTPELRAREPKLWGEKAVRDYEMTHINWYWGRTEKPAPHKLDNRRGIARAMMHLTQQYDETTAFQWTEAMHHTDRQGGAPGRNELIYAALGGRLQGRIEPFPHSIAVSWNNNSPDIARLVTYADDKNLNVNLYNFKSVDRKIKMRVWRLPKGEYKLQTGFDLNDDGMIDDPAALLRNEKIQLQRFSDIEFLVPSQKNIAVRLDLINASKTSEDLPDLSIHPTRDLMRSGNNLKVTVHNIGTSPAEKISVAILDSNNKVITKKIIPLIESPADFKQKTKSVLFTSPEPNWYKVKIDEKNRIEEIYEMNNEAVITGN